MKKSINISLLFTLVLLVILSCDKTDDSSENDSVVSQSIVYQQVNEEFVLIRDVQALQESNDEISNHVDSILNGLINAEYVSTGHIKIKLDNDIIPDIGFEIIDLNKFNPNGLPDSFDSLAARVIPLTIEILDNSTYGYPDALNLDDPISESGHWSNQTSVLGTFMNAGQFQGNGEKYLGIRFIKANNYKYGWIKLYCSQHNDTLRLIDFAYNNIENSQINAGQKE